MLFEMLLLEIRQSARRLLRSRAFTITAIASLALGTGANLAVFRLLDAVRMRSLPIPRAEQLVEIKVSGGTRGFGVSSNTSANATLPLWQEITKHQQTLSGVFAWGGNDVRLGTGSESVAVRGLWLSAAAFHVLDIQPTRGRFFEGDDNRNCDATSAVISHRFWQDHFGSRESALGTRIVVNDRPFSIVGVTGREFFGLEAGKGFDIAIPLCARAASDSRLSQRDLWWLVIMGRLRPTISLSSAAAEIRADSRAMFEAVTPAGYDASALDVWRGLRFTVEPAAGGISRLRNDYESSLWLLFGISGLVLLIACSNLANLLLTRARGRETEIAVKLALGISRKRLVAQLVIENLLLAAAGAAAGSVIGAILSRDLLKLFSTSHDPIELDLSGDWRLVLFSAALALFTCLVFGLTPILSLARTGVANVMRAGTRSSSLHPGGTRFQNALIASQVAISIVLLVGALSFVRSFYSLATFDPGFRKDGLLFCFADFSGLRFGAERVQRFQQELLATVRAAPGVQLAATSTHIPLSGNAWILGVKVAGHRAARSSMFAWVSTDYFHTLGIPMLTGRDFTAHDSAHSTKVLIVNEAFARQFAGTSQALGTVVRSVAEPGYPETAYEIVGVVKNAKYDSLREDTLATAYVPETQNPMRAPWSSFVIRSASPSYAVKAVTKALASKSPGVALHFEVLRTMMDDSLVRERLLAWLSGFFALIALLLAAIGVYGVVACVLSKRRTELAVRVALGATFSQIFRMILYQSGKFSAAGIAVGLGLSLATGRFVRSLLFGLSPEDLFTLVSAALTLALITALASTIPAIRAARVDPAEAVKNG